MEDTNNNLNDEQPQQMQRQEPEPSKTAIYVSNLPFILSLEELRLIFSDFEIKSATIALDRNGRSMGFGFVEFFSVEDQQQALKKDRQDVNGREIIVKVATNYLGPQRPRRINRRPPNNYGFRRGRRPFRRNFRPRRRFNFSAPRNPNTLYVSNLPFDLDSNDLREVFSEFNPKKAYVVTFRNGGSRGFGFIEFFDKQSQQDALAARDQCEVNGRVITVKLAKRTQNKRAPPRVVRREQKQREPSPTMLFVSNIPYSLTSEEFAEMFKDFNVKRSYITLRRNGISKGFGFVDFASTEEQLKALKQFKGTVCRGRQLIVQIAHKVENENKNNGNNNEVNNDDDNDHDDQEQNDDNDENNDNDN